MLAEERFSRILSIIEAEGSATIQELMTALDASESTVRRDLITMDENGLLTKVHGGAIARRPSVSTHDEDVRNRKTMNAEQRMQLQSMQHPSSARMILFIWMPEHPPRR